MFLLNKQNPVFVVYALLYALVYYKTLLIQSLSTISLFFFRTDVKHVGIIHPMGNQSG